jgi:hypothetical protein
MSEDTTKLGHAHPYLIEIPELERSEQYVTLSPLLLSLASIKAFVIELPSLIERSPTTYVCAAFFRT